MNLLSISDLRQNVAKIVDKLATKEPLIIMKRSKPQAVLVSHEYFTALEQSVLDLTDALEAEKAKKEPTVTLADYVKKRWPPKHGNLAHQ